MEKKPPSTLSKRQQREYADMIGIVPPEVIKEFDARLTEHTERWANKLRRALASGSTQSILTERDAATDDDDA